MERRSMFSTRPSSRGLSVPEAGGELFRQIETLPRLLERVCRLKEHLLLGVPQPHAVLLEPSVALPGASEGLPEASGVLPEALEVLRVASGVRLEPSVALPEAG
jgi:hypothetical protein